MCVKLPLGNLNSDPYPQHFTSTYTCGVTIASRVCGDELILERERVISVGSLLVIFIFVVIMWDKK